jgi:hypothetical protein
MTSSTRLTLFFTCVAAAIAATLGTVRQEGQGAGVRQLAYLKASNSEASDHFACGGSLPGHIGNALAVSGDGNTVAVGAPHESSAARGINGNQDDNSLYQSGAVYVYVRRGDAWTQQAYLKASNPGGSDMFGLSLAFSRDGNTLAVAAPWEASAATGVNGNQNDDSIPQAGAVYIFTRAGNTWSQHSYVKASNTGRKGVGDDIEGDQFGFSISLSGDGNTLAVGAVGEDSNSTGINGVPTDDSASGSGAIYAFDRRGGAWQQTGYFKGSRSQRNDALGFAVAISGDGNTIAAGTGDESCLNGGINPSGCDIDTFPAHLAAGSAGAAYVWVRSGDTWVEQAFIKASNPALEDWFGVRLALNGDGSRLLVGAALEDSGAKGVHGRQDDESAEDSGAAYLYSRTATSWSQLAYIKASNTDPYDEFGISVAISRDGRTAVAGARMESSAARTINGNQNDNEAGQSGAAYVFAIR